MKQLKLISNGKKNQSPFRNFRDPQRAARLLSMLQIIDQAGNESLLMGVECFITSGYDLSFEEMKSRQKKLRCVK